MKSLWLFVSYPLPIRNRMSIYSLPPTHLRLFFLRSLVGGWRSVMPLILLQAVVVLLTLLNLASLREPFLEIVPRVLSCNGSYSNAHCLTAAQDLRILFSNRYRAAELFICCIASSFRFVHGKFTVTSFWYSLRKGNWVHSYWFSNLLVKNVVFKTFCNVEKLIKSNVIKRI